MTDFTTSSFAALLIEQYYQEMYNDMIDAYLLGAK